MKNSALPWRLLSATVLGLALLAGPATLLAQYQGAESCLDCHDEQYYDWITSGHRFILMEGQDASNRPVPLPDGESWDDISYVVGGNKTKSLYLDSSGYLLTGHTQYNLLTGEWSDYFPGQANKTYDCGACHTTGYQSGGSPSGLPGISGTFALPGVQCEHCHGPGMEMTPGDTSAAFCGECHSHGPTNAVAAANGFIQSEGQYNEFLAGPHSALSNGCVSCHNPHQQAEFGITRSCSQCHSEEANAYAGTLMSKVGVECQDCHMAPATLSAQALGSHEGDMKSHIFYINTDPNASMFTANGANVALSGGKGALTLDFVCQRCHEGASLQELSRHAKDFHDDSRGTEDYGMDGGLTGTWWGGPSRDGEGFVLQFGYVPGTTTLTLFASFYTYDTMGNQVWMVALPTAGSVPTSGESVDVTVYRVTGPMWGAAFDPNDRNLQTWGTGTFSFPSCTSGSVSLTPGSEAQSQGFTPLSYDLTREDFLGTAIDCPAFANDTQ